MSKCKHPAWSKDAGLLLLRLAIGGIFIYTGYHKLIDTAGTEKMFGMVGIPAALAMAYLVGLVEFVGGILLVVGTMVCATAIPLAIVLIVALLTAHTKMPLATAFTPLAMLGGLFALMGAGGGKWGLGWKCGGSCGSGCGGKCEGKDMKKDGCGCGGNAMCGCGKDEVKK